MFEPTLTVKLALFMLAGDKKSPIIKSVIFCYDINKSNLLWVQVLLLHPLKKYKWWNNI